MRLFSKKNIEQAIRMKIPVTQEELEKITLWHEFYIGKAPHNKKDVVSLNIAAKICREVSTNATIEFETGIENNDYINMQYEEVIDNLRHILETACWGGNVMLRPNIVDDDILFSISSALDYIPLKFDRRGNITSALFLEHRKEENKYYTLITICDWTDGIYTIENTAYVSSSETVIGAEIPLTYIEEWADLEPVQTFYTDIPLFVNIEINNGESIYSRVIEQIRLLEENDAEITGEIRRARSMVFGPSEIVERDSAGNLKKIDKDIYVGIDKADVKVEIYNPEIRISELKERAEMIKRQIESTLNFYYGTISEPSNVERTATEIKHGRQQFFVLISDIQKELKKKLKMVVQVLDTTAKLYGLPSGYNEKDIIFNTPDNILVTETERQAIFKDNLDVLIKIYDKGELPKGMLLAFVLENSEYLHLITEDMKQEALKMIDNEAEQVNVSDEKINTA